MRQLLDSMTGLPGWVQVWMVVLFGTNLTSLAFLHSEVGVWTAVAFAAVVSLNLPTMVLQRGLTRLLALPHFLWVPLVAYLYIQLFGPNPLPSGGVRTFATMVLVVNSLSLSFDVREAYRWLRGERHVLGLPSRAD